jgi:hypothetical protein
MARSKRFMRQSHAILQAVAARLFKKEGVVGPIKNLAGKSTEIGTIECAYEFSWHTADRLGQDQTGQLCRSIEAAFKRVPNHPEKIEIKCKDHHVGTFTVKFTWPNAEAIPDVEIAAFGDSGKPDPKGAKAPKRQRRKSKAARGDGRSAGNNGGSEKAQDKDSGQAEAERSGSGAGV